MFCGSGSAFAGVMLPSHSGIVIASVAVESIGESDEIEDEPTTKLELEISRVVGQHTSSGGPNFSSSSNLFVGTLPTHSDTLPFALVFRLQVEVLPSFTNPFLDGILRPPIV
jgi:hypothetical protein